MICFKIDTGSEAGKEGTITVLVDRGTGYQIEVPSASYNKGSTVFESCFANGVRLAIQNTDPTGWAGAITANGSPMTCTNCDAGTSTSKIVVDGDTNGSVQAPTHCLSGKRCSLTYHDLPLLKLYIDGVLQSQTATIPQTSDGTFVVPTDPGGNVLIGQWAGMQNSDRHFVGKIKDVRLYETTLDAKAILALAQNFYREEIFASPACTATTARNCPYNVLDDNTTTHWHCDSLLGECWLAFEFDNDILPETLEVFTASSLPDGYFSFELWTSGSANDDGYGTRVQLAHRDDGNNFADSYVSDADPAPLSTHYVLIHAESVVPSKQWKLRHVRAFRDDGLAGYPSIADVKFRTKSQPWLYVGFFYFFNSFFLLLVVWSFGFVVFFCC
jgi:hypothetical protein